MQSVIRYDGNKLCLFFLNVSCLVYNVIHVIFHWIIHYYYCCSSNSNIFTRFVPYFWWICTQCMRLMLLKWLIIQFYVFFFTDKLHRVAFLIFGRNFVLNDPQKWLWICICVFFYFHPKYLWTSICVYIFYNDTVKRKLPITKKEKKKENKNE